MGDKPIWLGSTFDRLREAERVKYAWKVKPDRNNPEMYEVAGVYQVADNLPIEDAHLIAAAPDMLEALQNAPIPGRGEEMMAFRDRQDKWLREVSQPAIAKAEGRHAE